jgi:exosortase B
MADMPADLRPPSPLTGAASRDAWPWWIAGAGLALLYGPTYWNAAHGIWQTDDMGHGPIILAVVLWLFWGVRHQIAQAPVAPARGWGWSLLAAGLVFYAFARVFNISSVEFGSHLLVVTALLLLLRGPDAVKLAWFPLLYLIFLAPLPGTFVDAITQPLKHWISVIVVEALHAVGYPIARSGVMITVGQYQLLVADACSGLHSMFSLAALGTLFMYIMKRPSRLHNAVMLASIIPIAFTANIIRVIVLVLVTYHLGDEAGQGFLHGAAGMVLMLAALSLFFVLDIALALLVHAKGDSRAAST